MTRDGLCKHCGQTVIWAVFEESQKRVPLNPKPSENGNILITGTQEGVWRVKRVDPGEARASEANDVYETHFVNCPNAKNARRRDKAKK